MSRILIPVVLFMSFYYVYVQYLCVCVCVCVSVCRLTKGGPHRPFLLGFRRVFSFKIRIRLHSKVGQRSGIWNLRSQLGLASTG